MLSRPLSARSATQAREAFALFAQRQYAQAFSIARPLAGQNPESPDALHLLALCAAELQQPEQAEAAFKRALALVPQHPDMSLNFARFLGRQNRQREATEVLSAAAGAAPAHAGLQRALGLAALDAGQDAVALCALRRATDLEPGQSRHWQVFGSALRKTGALRDAEDAFVSALAIARDAHALANLAAIRRLLGRADLAAQGYREALALDPMRPDLKDALVGALIDVGDIEEARAAADRLTRDHPDFIPGYVTRAHLSWEYGVKEESIEQSLAFFFEAAQRDQKVAQALVSFLLEARCAPLALPLLASRRSDDSAQRLSYALALEATGDPRADEELDALHETEASTWDAYFSARIRRLVRAGDIGAAARFAEEKSQAQPLRQEVWAYLATLWRLLDDPREHWLCGYDTLVGEMSVPLPDDETIGHAALTAWLHQLHTARRAPSRQSLRGGSQTPGVLFGRVNPALECFEKSLLATIKSWIRRLPDDTAHPFLRRKQASVRFCGSWSVRLQSAGHHANHFHGDGWLSSACYIELPASVRAAQDNTGYLHFGQPPEELGVALEPRRFVAPREQHVALFPSYLWHGTVPFSAATPRLTIAFDAVPSDAAD